MRKPLNTVVELRSYSAKVAKLMDRATREYVVDLVAAEPESGVLIRGTGGVRKIRVALKGRGKSGGARVVYFYHDDTTPVFLLAAFAKNEQSNLTAEERNRFKELTSILVRTYGGTP